MGDFPVKKLIAQYKKDLYEEFLPFMDEFIIDHIHGGFKCHTDRDGRNITTRKRTWFDGRGVWVYSYLYNHFKKDDRFLEISKKTLDLLFKARENNRLWPYSYDQSGNDLKEHKPDIYGNLFVAEGLIEYSVAVKDDIYLEKAKEILFDCVDLYDSEGYLYEFKSQEGAPLIKMPRVLGHWMIMLSLCKSILKYYPEERKISDLSDRCMDALLHHHLNPDFDLMIEFLEKDMTIPAGQLSRFVYIGHAMEALWMLMDEAERREDEALFEKASTLFKRHVEVAWDRVYGGVFHGLPDVEQNIWLTDKVFWAQQEVLIGLMILISHHHDKWAQEKFLELNQYVNDHFLLKKHGFRYWNIGGDRKMTFELHSDRIENYHIPRHLMLNIQRLSGME